MGIIYKNGIQYSGVQNTIKEITKAQYDALSDTDKNKNIIYAITDADDTLVADQVGFNNEETGLEATNVQDALVEVNQNLSNITQFSSTEKIIGDFFGKPLYSKTYTGNGNWTSIFTIDSSITTSNIEPVDYKFSVKRSVPDWLPIWGYRDESISPILQTNGLKIIMNGDFTVIKYHLTIYYTKLTD